MRILITTPWVGGAGGVERLVRELCLALPDDRVDVVFTHRNPGELGELPSGVTIRDGRALRYRGANSGNPLLRTGSRVVIDPLRRLSGRYDIELALARGPQIGAITRSRLRLVNACGEPTAPVGPNELLWRESTAADRLGRSDRGCVILPPPASGIAAEHEPVTGLPDRFLLTVFNPHGPAKGVADLERIIDTLPLPLVWCHSRATVKFSIPDPLLVHPGIVHLDDPSHAQLRWLLETADAYLCVSRSESFGYAIADALTHARAVVSRPVGVLTYPEASSGSVFLVDDDFDVDWAALESLPPGRPDRDLSFLAPERFRRELVRLVDGPSA